MVKNINGLQFIAKIAAWTKDQITCASGLVSPLQMTDFEDGYHIYDKMT
jgi:hypothetical protein